MFVIAASKCWSSTIPNFFNIFTDLSFFDTLTIFDTFDFCDFFQTFSQFSAFSISPTLSVKQVKERSTFRNNSPCAIVDTINIHILLLSHFYILTFLTYFLSLFSKFSLLPPENIENIKNSAKMWVKYFKMV